MHCKYFLITILIFASLTTSPNVNAGVVALYDGNTEIAPQPPAGDQTASVINTALTTNGVYNTRSVAIGGTSTPHRSGVVPSNSSTTVPINGHYFVQSSVTGELHNRVAPSAAFHEFSIAVNDNQLGLDTLSFNYWATEGSVVDPELNTDITYSVRAHAEVINANGSSGFQTISSVISGNDSLRIQNPANNNQFLATSRNNVVTFDLSQLNALNLNDVVNFRLSFADEATGGGIGPNDNSHIHRLDNIQLEATSLSIRSVPEPSALSLLLGGLGVFALRRRR